MKSILGMPFRDIDAPDFGSIEQIRGGDYNLLAEDIPKLNNILTAAVCVPKLAAGSMFNVSNGAIAFVANWKSAGSAKAYMYHSGMDTWYEVIGNDDED